MENWKTLICILVIALIAALYLRYGGQEDVDDVTSRIGGRLSYWYYKISLWRDTEKVKHAYRYITCKNCGNRHRIRKVRQVTNFACPNCNHEMTINKKGKNI